jgi:hypothetical protein
MPCPANQTFPFPDALMPSIAVMSALLLAFGAKLSNKLSCAVPRLKVCQHNARFHVTVTIDPYSIQ